MKCKKCKEEGIFLPLRRELKPKTHAFSLDVPNYPRRNGYEFWFDRFELTPGFFDEAAFQTNLDTEELLQHEIYQLPLSYSVKFTDRIATSFVEPFFAEVPADETKPAKFVADFASHFEEKKLEIQPYCPVFFDWVVLDQLGLPVLDMNAHVEENFDTYYAEQKGPKNNALPPSVSAADDTGKLNHYVLPDEPHNHPNLRLRLNIMPNADATVRTQLPVMASLGFDAAQFEKESIRGKHIHYHLKNSGSSNVRSLTAASKIPGEYVASTARGAFVLELRPKDTVSPVATLLVTEAMMLGNSDQLMREVNRALATLNPHTNLKLRVIYNSNEDRYQFQFPNNFLISVEYHLPKPVAEVLGYYNTGADPEIVTRAVIGRRVLGYSQDPGQKAKTLTHDTGQVLVVQDGVSAFNLHCHNDSLVAYLLPNGKGQLQLSQLSCYSPALTLAGQAMSSEKPDHTTVNFSLLQVKPGGMEKLAWPCHSVLDAVVVGWPCACLR